LSSGANYARPESLCLRAWLADIDAAHEAAAKYGCDPHWCTAHRWDGHHVPTCKLAREAAQRAGLPDELAKYGYREQEQQR
jgi:hypothetical protein